MDITELLRGLGESLADYMVANNLKEIGETLDELADSVDDPARKVAYRIAAEKVLEATLERLSTASEKLPNVEKEIEKVINAITEIEAE